MASEIVTALQVQEIDGTLLVDSRLIAERLGIQHKNLFATIKKYSEDFKEFGHLAFETETVTNSAGASNTAFFVFLSEPQATYLMTLSKNTAQVRRCKLELVTAFEKAKTTIKTVILAQNEQLEMMRLENENLKLKSGLISLHGKETALLLMGHSDRLVEIEKPMLEVVNRKTTSHFIGQSCKQVAEYIQKRTGKKFKSGAEVERVLRASGRDDLIEYVERPQKQACIPKTKLDQAYQILMDGDRQRLIGE
jgi:phage regulator Rha-like protein